MNDQDNVKWEKYYQMVAGRPPREFLRRVFRRVPETGRAIDLGCGAGIESRLMLEKGWRVLAIDQQVTAIEQLKKHPIPLIYRAVRSSV